VTDAARGWTTDDSHVFLEDGRYFVPDRGVQIATICAVVPEPPEGGLIVDLGCGEGLLARALLGKFPSARVLGLDPSAEMRKEARKTCGSFGARFECRPFSLADRNWRDFAEPPHAVVSILTVHHVDGDTKRALFRDVGERLAPAGALLLADLVQPTTPEGMQLAAHEWDRAVRHRALELDGHLAAFQRFQRLDWNLYAARGVDPVDQPSSLAEQLRWLEEAGLVGADVWWMRAGHAVFGAFKPAV
jgi:tRNA (cmo5U34)-methyltransferase